MFLQDTDLGAIIYDHQLAQIVEDDDTIVLQAMQVAEEEVKGYLTENNKREHLDGRLRYDVDAIFSAQGNERNSLLVRHASTIAKWYIVELCNAEVLYENIKERYDRATEYLKKLAKGEVNISSLPQINTDNNPAQPFSMMSRNKFNHNY